MRSHRLVIGSSFACYDIRRPFSNFDFVDDNFGSLTSLRRIFSQARALRAKSMVIENIPATGIIADENREIAALARGYRMTGLKRISFWASRRTTQHTLSSFDQKDFVGYALLKHDQSPSRKIDSWHVFESVFPSYPHARNCVPDEREYVLRVGNVNRSVRGTLYCQQNRLNKSCAHVALRTLLSLHFNDTAIPYRRINTYAVTRKGTRFNPAKGLTACQIRRVLNAFGLNFRDVDYGKLTRSERRKLPYQKYLYAGVESGAGALLGFKFTGRKAKGEKHIIPFFGHTFNQNTWIPDADGQYFHVGDRTRYVASESWVGSYVGHDDNFGSNFCVPRLYVTPHQAQYVVELWRGGVEYGGVTAEAIGVNYFYSILPQLKDLDNRWLSRLAVYASDQKVVLRAVALSRAEYIDHWSSMRDWNNRREDHFLIKLFQQFLPKRVWMVEVSLPQLFPANQRKLGELVLDATVKPENEKDFGCLVFARLPGHVVFVQDVITKGKTSIPDFATVPSALASHTPVLRCAYA